MRSHLVGSFLGLVCLIAPIGAVAQPAIRKQATDNAPPQAMTPAELAQLGDPLFVLVLKTRPQETRLDEIERLLMGTSGQRHLFVVHEDLQIRPEAGRGAPSPRTVAATSPFAWTRTSRCRWSSPTRGSIPTRSRPGAGTIARAGTTTTSSTDSRRAGSFAARRSEPTSSLRLSARAPAWPATSTAPRS